MTKASLLPFFLLFSHKKEPPQSKTGTWALLADLASLRAQDLSALQFESDRV